MVSVVVLARAISFLGAWKSFLKASRSMRDSSCSRRFVFQKFIAVGCGMQNLPAFLFEGVFHLCQESIFSIARLQFLNTQVYGWQPQ